MYTRKITPINASAMIIRYACLLAVLSVARCLDQYIEDTDRFPGWKGELPSSIHSGYNEERPDLSYAELGEVCAAVTCVAVIIAQTLTVCGFYNMFAGVVEWQGGAGFMDAPSVFAA